MNTSIKVTVSQPLPSMPKMDPYQNKPLKPVPQKDMPMVEPPPNRPPEEAPFIPNDKDSQANSPFEQKDGIDFYVDSGRFFPENAGYTRITIHGYTKTMRAYIDPVTVHPDIETSRVHEPFYGYRNEIRLAKMDPTSLIIFTLDSFDLSTGKRGIAGHAIFPLFIDTRTKSPCDDPKQKSFTLQEGDYQIPVYSEFPKDIRNLTFSNFTHLDKIPACSLLIRIRKAAKGDDGKPQTLKNLPMEKAIDIGIIATPKQYNEGNYNTKYCPVSSTELIIMEAKLKRHFPLHRELLEILLVQKTGEEKKMNEEDLRSYCEKDLLGPPIKTLTDLSKIDYLDPRYFSEYIPQLGFRTGVEYIHNSPTKSFFFVVMSLVSSGGIYKKDTAKRGLNEIHAATDIQTMYKINFHSPQKAIMFTDGLKNFYLTQPSTSEIIIYEIFEVNLRNNVLEKVDPFGFSVLQVFQAVETDGKEESKEMYLNTSIEQLPVFKGRPDNDFIERIKANKNVIGFVQNNINKKTLEVHPKVTLIVKLIDNQFDKKFENQESASEKIGQSYMVMKNAKNYKFNFKKDVVGNSAVMQKLLPKKMTSSEYESAVFEFVQTNI